MCWNNIIKKKIEFCCDFKVIFAYLIRFTTRPEKEEKQKHTLYKKQNTSVQSIPIPDKNKYLAWSQFPFFFLFLG